MKITLNVNGRESTFSEQELIAILEEYFSNVGTEPTNASRIAKILLAGRWFEVNPLTLNQELFLEKREDKNQEKTRQLILEAFTELKSNPQKYGRKFVTMIPNKTWKTKKVYELKEFACKSGGHMANWVEQALEWAQRISNGESWRSICNKIDTALWYRAVEWKNGRIRLIGGAVELERCEPASTISIYDYSDSFEFSFTVPLVVLYEK